MRIVFRADASQLIGSGHVMRLSLIAEEALVYRIPIVFVGKIDGVHWLKERIDSLGFQSVHQNISDFIPDNQDVLFLDSYIFETCQEAINHCNWRLSVALIDRATQRVGCDIVFHLGLEAKRFVGKDNLTYSGAEYIPVRKAVKRSPLSIDNFVKKISVVGGGTDTFDFSESIAEILASVPGFSSAVFFSNNNQVIESLDSRFTVKPIGSKLEGELSESDLVFTTAGTISLEIAARGIPNGIACAVENQQDNYFSLSERGVSRQIGKFSKEDGWQLSRANIVELIENYKLRLLLCESSQSFLDFNGSTRIIQTILENFDGVKC